MLKNKKIAFIGSGNMAEALISSLLDSSVFNPDDISCSDISKKRLEYVHNIYKIYASSDNTDVVQKADIIILSVKPQIILKVLDQISETVDSSNLVISIAAGISLDIILKVLSKDGAKTIRLIRAMPNTPALVQTGATALAKGAHASENDLKAAFEIFSAVGKAVEINEDLMDAVTGLSGSGPAYVFLIIDALADAGVKVGLPKDISMTLSVQTVLGAARLASESADSPAKWKDMVTSPGGTTIAGINSLEKGNLKTVLINAVEAATQRSRELGSIQKKNAGL